METAWDKIISALDDADKTITELETAWDKIISALDDAGKTITELQTESTKLRARNAELEKEVARLEAERRRDALDGQAALDEANNEVARLRKALRGLYEHTKNDMQIAGLNVAANEALEARDG